MSGKPAKAFPVGPILAIVGGGLGIASLLMPWFTFNTVAVNHAMDTIYSSEWVKGQQMIGFPIQNAQATMHATVATLTPKYVENLHGYQTYSQVSVGVQAGAAALAILVGILGLFGLLRRRGLLLFACAIAMMGRQLYSLVIPPADKIMQSVGFENTHLLVPTGGFWVGIVAGVVLIASTFGITARAAAQYEMPPGKYGNAGPHVATLGGNGSASSQPQSQGGGAPAYGAPNYGSGQAYVPGVGGAMHSSTPIYGTDPSPAAGTPSYGAAPQTPRRSGPPPQA